MYRFFKYFHDIGTKEREGVENGRKEGKGKRKKESKKEERTRRERIIVFIVFDLLQY